MIRFRKYKAPGEKDASAFHVFQSFLLAVLHLHSFKESAEAAGTEMERNSTTAKFGIQERKRDPVNQN
jgi:hypothetical protein